MATGALVIFLLCSPLLQRPDEDWQGTSLAFSCRRPLCHLRSGRGTECHLTWARTNVKAAQKRRMQMIAEKIKITDWESEQMFKRTSCNGCWVTKFDFKDWLFFTSEYMWRMQSHLQILYFGLNKREWKSLHFFVFVYLGSNGPLTSKPQPVKTTLICSWELKNVCFYVMDTCWNRLLSLPSLAVIFAVFIL